MDSSRAAENIERDQLDTRPGSTNTAEQRLKHKASLDERRVTNWERTSRIKRGCGTEAN